MGSVIQRISSGEGCGVVMILIIEVGGRLVDAHRAILLKDLGVGDELRGIFWELTWLDLLGVYDDFGHALQGRRAAEPILYILAQGRH
jgi:hypothetical protein